MPKVKSIVTKKPARKAYLTKRRLASAARIGIRIAAEKTMQVMGYTVVVHRGWVVKKYQDGKIEKITALARQKKTTALKLD